MQQARRDTREKRTPVYRSEEQIWAETGIAKCSHVAGYCAPYILVHVYSTEV